MLSLPPDTTLTAAERYALDVLVDLSAVLRLDGTGDVVRLELSGAAEAATVSQLRARRWGIQVADGVVTVERATLRAVTEIAGAAAEQRVADADRFGRVPAAATRSVQEGVEREPVVSVAARALADAVREAAGRRAFRAIDPWPEGRRWAAALSHDLDVVEWWPAFTLLRLLELARNGELSRAVHVAASAIGSATSPVVWNAVSALLETEARHAVRSSWFVLCGTPTLASARAGDLTYRPESPAARRIIAAIREAGHEIGLHGSFATSDDHALFIDQRRRLATLAGAEPAGVRQHYLRMRAATTPRGMTSAGFTYDATSGFADRNGFRIGVADVVPSWDDERDAPAGIDEVPFTWMDRALSKYQHVENPEIWIDDALALADRCRAVEGMWVGIWHPNLAPALGFPGAPAAYERLVAGLRSREPYIAPIGELVEWRRARRSLRASALAADGRVVLGPRESSAPRFTIRDAGGRADDPAGTR